MSDAPEVLTRIGVVPVVVIDDAGRARDLARTLRDNGVATAEITLRTTAGLDAIRIMSEVEGFLVGAGTVLIPEDADAAIDAGAAYLVSPGLDLSLVRRAHSRGVPFVPGVGTATDVQNAVSAGLTHLKLFPASTAGGKSFIDAVAGPFPGVRFLPSGGVSTHNMLDYLSSPAVFAVSGSWLAPREAIAAGDFDLVAARTAETSRILAAGRADAA